MKYIQQTLILLTITAIGACSSGKDRLSPDVVKVFADNGRTADSLRKAYVCESVTLDKWKETDLTDSIFSFCLINAKKLPTSDVNLNYDVLGGIARSIKRSINLPNRYNSFQIVFVKSGKMFWFGGQTQIHSPGGIVPGIDL